MAQVYKGDQVELQYYNSAAPISDELSSELSDFFVDAYKASTLGAMLYDTRRSPLANAITRDIFRESFAAIFDAFIESGTFESYLVVFRKIFGDEVEVIFTVPAPGKLQIDIEASGLDLSNWVARSIVENVYLFEPIIDHEGNNLVFQTIKGFQSQYELEQMLFELVPAGIYTEITLTLGV